MPNPKTDRKGFTTVNPDLERDMAAKGGPTTTLGSPDSNYGASVVHPYDEDLQAQIAAKGGKKQHRKETRKNKKIKGPQKQQ